MDPLSLFIAIPKMALFLLLIVGGAIVAEVFYFQRKQRPTGVDFGRKKPATPEVSLPPSHQATQNPLPTESANLAEKVGQSPPLLTTEVIPPPTKTRLSRKTLTTLAVVLLLVVAVPAAALLVKQRQETRKRAQGYGECCACHTTLDENLECIVMAPNSCDTPDLCPSPTESPTPQCSPDECCDNDTRCDSNGQCTIIDEGCASQPYCGNLVCDSPGEDCVSCPVDCPSCCKKNGESCEGETNEVCCSLICNYGTCRGDNPQQGCGSLNEIECAVNGVYCYWYNGACIPRPETSPPPEGNVTCDAGSGGVAINNNTCHEWSGNISWFSLKCDNTTDCMCGGSSNSESVVIPPCDGCVNNPPQMTGCHSWSKGISGNGCAWQSDVAGAISCSGSGCLPCETPPPSGTPHPTPTPTPPGYVMQCLTTGMFDSDWGTITDFSTLTVGQTVFFAAHGSTDEPQGLTKARFRINGTADATWCTGSGNILTSGWCETTNIHGTDFYVQFTIPASGSFNVESMVYNPALGWN